MSSSSDEDGGFVLISEGSDDAWDDTDEGISSPFLAPHSLISDEPREATMAIAGRICPVCEESVHGIRSCSRFKIYARVSKDP